MEIPSKSSLDITITVSVSPAALRRFVADMLFSLYAASEDKEDRKVEYTYGKDFDTIMETLTDGEYKKDKK